MSFLKWSGSGLLALLALLLFYGIAIEPRFLLDVQEHEVEVPNLPQAWDGQQVALIADLQVGMWLDNTGMIEKTVEEIIEHRPAVVLIAGDFLYKPDSATVEEAVALVRPLPEAGLRVLAALGNHDYSLNKKDDALRRDLATYLATSLEDAGIDVLENEAVPLDTMDASAPFYAVGVGSHWAERSNPQQALAGVPEGAARLVFMHNPVAYREMPAHTAPATFAAHTHAGQIRLPILPSESWLDIAQPREVVADGWAEDDIGAAGNRLYVNRGLGFSAVPIRIFCRPELSLFTLRPAAGTLPERGPGS